MPRVDANERVRRWYSTWDQQIAATIALYRRQPKPQSGVIQCQPSDVPVDIKPRFLAVAVTEVALTQDAHIESEVDDIVPDVEEAGPRDSNGDGCDSESKA
jgi:hypothetical protein